jgi:hypothetical protein
MPIPQPFAGYLNRKKTLITFFSIAVVSAVLMTLAIYVPWSAKVPYQALLIGLGTSIGATLVIQVTTTWFTGWLKNLTDLRFEQFFGNGSLTRDVRGKIVVQSDSINALMRTLLREQIQTFAQVEAALGRPEGNRLFKARHWVNTRDVECARFIRDKIRSFGFPTPDLRIIEHPVKGDPFAPFKDAPYVISTGLAFTETSIFLGNQCDPKKKKFVIVENSPKGDALAVPEGFAYFDRNFFETVPIDKTRLPPGLDEGWRWLFPKDWDLRKWGAEQRPEHKDPLNDYAVIIRYRHPDGRKQVRFMVAGFTEDTTLKAGEYLVEKWEYLQETFVSKKIENFVVVVHGDRRHWSNPIQVFP